MVCADTTPEDLAMDKPKVLKTVYTYITEHKDFPISKITQFTIDWIEYVTMELEAQLNGHGNTGGDVHTIHSHIKYIVENIVEVINPNLEDYAFFCNVSAILEGKEV